MNIEKIARENVATRPVVNLKSSIPASSQKPKFFKKILALIISLIILGLGGATYYFYSQYKKVVSSKGSEVNEAAELKKEVGSLIELPTDEEPTIATVADKEKLKIQPFFSKAENGDKVLIYSNAQKALLYRPSTKKIIEVNTFSAVDQENEYSNQNNQSSNQIEEQK